MEAAAAAPSKAKRVRKTPQEKQAILRFLEDGGSPEAAAARFGVARAAVAKLLLKDQETPTEELAASASSTSTESGSESSTAASASGQQQPPLLGKRTRGASSEAATEQPKPGKNGADDSELLAAALSPETAATRKRVRKTKEEKLAILQFVEQGGTHASAAEKFGVSRTAVTKMVKEREIIVAKTQTSHRSASNTQRQEQSMENGTERTTKSPLESNGLEASMPAAPATSESKGDATALADALSAPMAASQSPIPPVLQASAPPVELTVATAAEASTPAVPTVATAAAPSMPMPSPDAASPRRSKKGRRVRKTNLEKMEILTFVDQGGSQGAAAEKFGVSRTAVTKMVKERAAITAQALMESSSSSRKVLQYQHKLSIIEDMLYKWQMQIELDAPALKITGDLLQSKAMEFRNKILADYSSDLSDEVVLSLTDFKASNGWLHRYMQRRSVRSLPKLQAQAATAAAAANLDRTSGDQRIERIREQLLEISPSCIWNLDELALRHRTTSARLDSIVNLDARSLERISVAMAVSAAGEKLQLQVVGKDPNPPSLKDVDALTAYEIQYRDQCRAWHDSHAIVEFIQAMNTEATTRNQLWYLVLDSCAAHVAAAHALDPSGSYRNGFKFDATVLLFLPPGSTSDVQPLHQGIFQSFKLQFRREMLQTLIHEHELSTAAKRDQQQRTNRVTGEGEAEVDVVDAFDVHAHTHMRNTLSWLQKAWNSVSTQAICRAWSACLYLPAGASSDDTADAVPLVVEEGDEGKASLELMALLSTTPTLRTAMGLDGTDDAEQFIQELLDFDKAEPNGTYELAKDDEIVMESLSSQGLLRDAQRVLEELKEDEPQVLTMSEASATVTRLLRFMTRDNDNQLTMTERRTARANLLVLQRLLFKVQARERERVATTDFTV
ncbi:hypothetical protein BBJ28_00001633 [Nothophytophthora sp. Chile5]|nr:hypothetical protein BBJ28_00001633 [Nothophytophthora sp. Chile5]